MQKIIKKGTTKVTSSSLIEIKKANPDFQIPMINDRPFKTVCKKYQGFINKIIVELLGIDPRDIEKAYFVDTELPLDQHDNKKMIVDLLLHVADDSLINIEAYTNLTAGNILKNNQYVYRIILKEQDMGEGYKNLNLVQLIFVKNRIKLFKDKLVSVFTTREEETNEILPYTPKMIYVSLANLEEIDYNEDGEWVYKALKMLTSDSIEESKQLAGDDPILSKVAEFMKNYSNQYSNLMYVNEQEEQEKVYNTDMALAAETGENKGRLEGRIEGHLEGRLEEKQTIVKNSLKNNLDIETIAKITNLSIEEIQKIKDSLEK